jgi:ATP-binding cassette subfamily C protein CydD
VKHLALLLRQTPQARRWIRLAVGLGVLVTTVTIGQFWCFSQAVAGAFVLRKPVTALAGTLALLLLLTLLRAGLSVVQDASAQEGALRLKRAVRRGLLQATLQRASSSAGAEGSGSQVATVMDGVDRLEAYAGSYVPLRSLSVWQPLLILLFLLPLDWVSALILLCTVPVIPLLMLMVGSYTAQRVERQWDALTSMSGVFLDTIQGLTTIKAFGRGDAFGDRIRRASLDFGARTMRVLQVAFISGLVLDFMTSVAIGVVAVTLGARLLTGGMSFASALLVLLLAPEFYRPLRELGNRRHAAMEGTAAAETITQLLDHHTATQYREPVAEDGLDQMAGERVHLTSVVALQGVASAMTALASGMTTIPGYAPGAPPRPYLSAAPCTLLFPSPRTMCVDQLSYTYPGRTVPALAGVSFSLACGTRTALVGRTGSGKSTLVNLLLRSLEPSSGMIAVDGTDISTLAIDTWRRHIAVVPQRPHLFHGSLLENLRLALPTATISEIGRALELAGAEEVIAALPEGLDTVIGEGGSGLSSGEVQRLALARAFLKNAPVLVLDEPTASLDPRSEQALRAGVERLSHGRTVLIVAHRLATLLGTDQIVVLEAGRVAGIGAHATLRQSCEAYAALLGPRSVVPA